MPGAARQGPGAWGERSRRPAAGQAVVLKVPPSPFTTAVIAGLFAAVVILFSMALGLELVEMWIGLKTIELEVKGAFAAAGSPCAPPVQGLPH